MGLLLTMYAAYEYKALLRTCQYCSIKVDTSVLTDYSQTYDSEDFGTCASSIGSKIRIQKSNFDHKLQLIGPAN